MRMLKNIMETETIKQRKSAEDMRQKAIERLNSDFAPQPDEPTGNDCFVESQVVASPSGNPSPCPASTLPDEVFFSSQNSQLGKARKWVWVGLSVGVLSTVAGSKGSVGSIGFTVIFCALVGVLIDWFLRRQLVTNEAAVTLTQDGIESRLFSGKSKKHRWAAVVGVSLEGAQNARMLQLQLDSAQGFSDKRNFWTGRNEARPALPLASFESSEQERLYESLRRRLQISTVSESAGSDINPLTEEREFQERLKSLAPIPWVTYGLIAINAAIWLATVMNGAGFIRASPDKLLLWGGNATSEFQRGEWWRLVTATFLHSGIIHVAMNMIGLASAGGTVERIYGHRQFILLYLGSGLLGSALSLHFSAQHAVSVGASGAVFGVTGALLVALLQHREKLPKTFTKQTTSGLAFFIMYSLVQGLSRPNIDNAAHIGGLLGGCLLAYVLPERFDMAHFKTSFARRGVSALVILSAATVSIAAMAPQAKIDQARIFSSNESLVQTMKRFDEAMKTLQQEQAELKAGKISERDVDERSRVLHAPVFRKIADDLSRIELRPDDQRVQLTKGIQRMAELLYESLAMDSVFNEESKTFEPIDPVRAKQIDKEVGLLAEQTTNFLNALKNKSNPKKPSPGVGDATNVGTNTQPPANGWSLELAAFQGGMSVQEVIDIAKANGHVLKCYGNLKGNERVRNDDTQSCWVTLQKAWGVPASMMAVSFGGQGLQTQLFRFPEASWPQVREQLDRMGQHLPQTFGADHETGGPVIGWRTNSGLVLSSAPPKGKEVTVLWTAKLAVAADHCSNHGATPKREHQSYSVPVNELWPEIECELPKKQVLQDCSERLSPKCSGFVR